MLGGVRSIGDGDHVAVVAPGGHVGTAGPGTYLLHFPMRSYTEFEQKIAMYAQDFAANPQLADGTAGRRSAGSGLPRPGACTRSIWSSSFPMIRLLP